MTGACQSFFSYGGSGIRAGSVGSGHQKDSVRAESVPHMGCGFMFGNRVYRLT